MCIDRYSGLAWSLARRFLGNEADAEEAVQDIFIELWRRADRFDPKRAEEVAFVSMIARRRIIDRLRQVKRHPASESMDKLPEPPGLDESAALEASVETGRVIQVLESMAPEQRQVIHMSAWLGMSHAAIAERCGMPLGTVKSHLRRGLKRVREQLSSGPMAGGGVNP